MKKSNKDVSGTTTTPGGSDDTPSDIHDAVFGEISEDGPNYRSVGWLGTAVLMMKTQIGLGVLSIPVAFDALGMIPGLIVLIAMAVITGWSDYIIGAFKLRHREVYGVDDAGALIFGTIGRVIFGGAFWLYWTFVAGSGMLSISIGLNAVSMHGACTAIFVAVAAVCGFSCASIRTLGRISWLAWFGLFSIVTAILIVTISVGIQDRPASAPKDGVWVSDYKLTNTPSFTDAITAVSSIMFAYSGTAAYFPIAAEMREPRHYTRSLILSQSLITVIYIAIGTVVCYYCGSYVASPALGSAGPLLKKVSYGFAIPGLLVTTVLGIHVSSKYMFVQILRGSKHLTADTFVHWGTWLSCTSGVAIVAYLVASGIPVFGGLVSLIGALLGTLLCFQLMGFMWLYDNWSKGKETRSWAWMVKVAWAVFVIAVGCFLTVAGTYGSVVSIMDSYKTNGGTRAWSCSDNSNSV